MKDLQKICAVLSLTLSLSTAYAQKHDASRALPNIIFLLADDAGVGEYQPYSDEIYDIDPAKRIQTPKIKKLAAEGMTFTSAYSAGSVCQPSRYAINTGRLAFHEHISGTVSGNERRFIEEDRTTLAQMLQQQGYQTAMVGKWHLDYLFQDKNNPKEATSSDNKANLAAPMPLGVEDAGYDFTFWLPKGVGGARFFISDRRVQKLTGEVDYTELHPDKPAWSGHDRWTYEPLQEGEAAQIIEDKSILGDAVTDAALEFMERAQEVDKPFFLYFAAVAPHAPHIPAEELNGTPHIKGTVNALGQYIDDTRRQMVYENDIILGQLTEQLERLGIADNTLVIFSSDNGPGVPGVRRNSAAGVHNGHKGTAWEGGNRIPLIVKWPGVIAEGSRCDDITAQVDTFATLAELAGLAALPEGVAEDSISFLSTLKGENEAPVRRWNVSVKHKTKTTAAYEDGYFNVAIRHDNWKLIATYDETRNAYLPHAFYDLDKDIGETNNLLFNERYDKTQLKLMLKWFENELDGKAKVLALSSNQP